MNGFIRFGVLSQCGGVERLFEAKGSDDTIRERDPDTLAVLVTGNAPYSINGIGGIEGRLFMIYDTQDRMVEIDPDTFASLHLGPDNDFSVLVGTGGTKTRFYTTTGMGIFRISPDTFANLGSVKGTPDNIPCVGGIENRLYCVNGANIEEIDPSFGAALKSASPPYSNTDGIGGTLTRLYATCDGSPYYTYELDPDTLASLQYVSNGSARTGIGGIK